MIKLVDVINGKMKVQMVPLVLSKLLKWKNTCLACVCSFYICGDLNWLQNCQVWFSYECGFSGKWHEDPTDIAKQMLVCHLLNFGNVRCVSEHVCGFPIHSVCGDASLCVVLLTGLAFDSWDLDYYTSMFQKIQRNPTSVECFDLAQSNR